MLQNDVWVEDFEENKLSLIEIYPDVNISTMEFIVDSYENSSIEKRINSTHKKAIKAWDVDLQEWDITDGVVRNVVAFWAFVDIGLKNDGLVHISQITDKFIKDPKEVLEVWQSVKVKLTKVDEATWKIQLSMKNL